jgi:hypothetical protein
VLPAGAQDLYEDLRAAVLRGQARVEGVGAIVFHGLWRGMAVLIADRTTPAASALPAPSAPVPAGTHDRQLVRLLANMVLAAEAQVNHAY